jgi:hypothetical protein
MSLTWESVLERYRAQNLQVLTRESLLHSSLETLINGLPISVPTLSFLQQLSHSQLSLWDALFISVLSVHGNLKEKEAFPPLKQLIDRVTQVAVIYGEHFAWKSPDKWSYLFQVRDLFESNTYHYFLAHPPATVEQIHQAETVLGMHLPPTYVCLLKLTNGLGLYLDERSFICGVGDARATWDEVVNFQKLTYPRHVYHEITSNWLQWQDVLEYERERDRETRINTFLSNERVCVPFAYKSDDWCFDRSQQNEDGEYPILFRDHELREAIFKYPDFEVWFIDIVTNRRT